MAESHRSGRSGTRHAVASRTQDELWFLHQLAPHSPAHNVCSAYRVTGALDLPALREAWRAVVGRHEILRTTFAERDGRPVQVLAAAADDRLLEPSSVELRPAGPTAAEASPEWFCATVAGAPFNLAEGPLARLAAARLGASEHVVVLVAHQAVADEESLQILVHELSECYAAAVAGRSPADALPAPLATYADYARWQREAAAAPEYRHLEGWWREALAAAPPSLPLPADRSRPSGPSVRGGAVRFDWGAQAGRLLAERCRAEGATPFAVLLTAFQALLSRYVEGDRVTVGVPASVRPRPEFAGLVGPCANLLVLPGDFSGAPTFREALARVAARARDAFDHRELPFDHLVWMLNVERDPRRIPFCDALLAFRRAPYPDLRLPGAAVRREHVHNGGARADLALTVDETAPTLAGSLEYRDSLFDRASAEHMLDQLRTLLIAALDDPDLPVTELPLETVERLREAARDADRVGAGAPVRPVNELVHAWAERHPDAAAVSWNGSLSYGELSRRAASVSAALRALGAGGGVPVAVRTPPGPRQVAALLGVLDAGAHLVCIGTADAGERGKAVLAELRPACLLVEGDPGEDALAAWYRSELEGRVLDLAALEREATPPDHEGELPTMPPVAPAAAGAGLGRRAYVAYTSGSTGRPKGIPMSHGSLAQLVTWLAGESGIRPGSRVAQWAAPGYDASLMEAFAALTAGATLCPVPERMRASPEKVADWLVAEEVSFFQTVPSFARELLKAIKRGDSTGVGGVRETLGHLLLAGEPLSGELANDLRATLPATRLINLYGPTESILATWQEIASDVHGVAPIGRSIPGRQVLVLDELDRPCPAGTTGEIVVCSPHVTPGYIGGDSGNSSPFRPLRGLEEFGIRGPRCYRTGDRGRRRWDGALEFHGRGDSQVKFRGARIELAEIESALGAHESVSDCAVVAWHSEHGLVDRLVAYVVPHSAAGEGAALTDAWRAELRRRFGRTTLALTFKIVPEIPRNLGGKVDWRMLPTPGPAGDGPARMISSTTERAVAAIWSELLGVEQIRADDGFFMAGGHSLQVPQLLRRIYTRFGVELSVWDFFETPTVAGLAAVVNSRDPSPNAVTDTMIG